MGEWHKYVGTPSICNFNLATGTRFQLIVQESVRLYSGQLILENLFLSISQDSTIEPGLKHLHLSIFYSSCDKHLRIWLYNSLHSANFGRIPNLIHSKTLCSPSFLKSFNCYIKPNFIAIFETVCHCFSR